MSDEQSEGLFAAVKSIEAIAPKLEQLLERWSIDSAQSSESIALLRGKANRLMWSGTIQLKGSSGQWRWNADYTVPFARVAYIDSLGNGPYVISTDATGATTGPGTYTSFNGGGDAALVPLIGRQLFISSAKESDGPINLFIAVFTDVGPSNVN